MNFVELESTLRRFGVRLGKDRAIHGRLGFTIHLSDDPLDNPVTIDRQSPPLLDQLSPLDIGVALLDHSQRPIQMWGLARSTSHLQFGVGISPQLQEFLEEVRRGGTTTTLIDQHRYFASVTGYGTETLIFLVDAHEEAKAQQEARVKGRMADSLRSLGKALTMSTSLIPMCVSAAREISSINELASVLIWVHDSDTETLELAAHAGVSRSGVSALSKLSSSHSPATACELAAVTRRVITLPSTKDNLLTRELEAKITYLRPGGLHIFPLEINGKLLGVLELISREDDPLFFELGPLFETMSEHLTLAMHSAMMFQNFERLASHDALTGLANHRNLHETLEERLQEAERNGNEVGVLMIDVDHFRAFNEEEGHDAGDEVLRVVANVLKSCLRPYDLAARYGGEEFSVIMPGSNVKAAMAVAERMRESIEATHYINKSGVSRRITASFGVAVYPATAEDSSGLMKAADVALYEAKRHGRNRCMIFQSSMHGRDHQLSRELESSLTMLSGPAFEAGVMLVERLSDKIDHIASRYRLTTPQIRILEVILQLAPEYMERKLAGEPVEEELAQTEGHRVLAPNLTGMFERVDGSGHKGLMGQSIPTLSRLAQALLAYDSGDLKTGILDRDVVEALSDPPIAA